MAAETQLLGFVPPDREVRIGQIVEVSGLSYKTVYTGLQSLALRGLLEHRRTGWTHLYRLNLASPAVAKHLEMTEVERGEAFLHFHGDAFRQAFDGFIRDLESRTVPVIGVIALGGTQSLWPALMLILPEKEGYGLSIQQAAAAQGLRVVTLGRRILLTLLSRGLSEPVDLRLTESARYGPLLYGYEALVGLRIHALREAREGEQPPPEKTAPSAPHPRTQPAGGPP
ncbi:MAG: hypothetical protein HY558_04935 [Euryarchaeota archaeon]|nr:hypothetical protein [Euryarchaeota archaeon]